MTVKVHRQAILDLLKSPAVVADLEARGRRIARAAGPGHRVDSEVGKIRARVGVITDPTEARRSEARSRSLTRAIDAAR
jgi:hypothetical protein